MIIYLLIFSSPPHNFLLSCSWKRTSCCTGNFSLSHALVLTYDLNRRNCCRGWPVFVILLGLFAYRNMSLIYLQIRIIFWSIPACELEFCSFLSSLHSLLVSYLSLVLIPFIASLLDSCYLFWRINQYIYWYCSSSRQWINEGDCHLFRKM